MVGKSLPRPVLDGLLDRLQRRTGRAQTILSVRSLAGGCINSASRVDLSAHPPVFLKWNDSSTEGLFEAEAEGLTALAAATSLRVPRVLAHAPCGASGPGWLALEFIARGQTDETFSGRLARGLSELHTPDSAIGSTGFGWERDNYIGTLAQRNEPSDEWPLFWRDRRLLPQLQMASGWFGKEDLSDFHRLLEALPRLLEAGQREGFSLLHGDFWNGNVFPGPEGEPVLIDPACYRGHREVDLAMSELFGGFPLSFLPAYQKHRPLEPGYETGRRDVYQLYPLLVHVNLFGATYVESTRRTLMRALASVSRA